MIPSDEGAPIVMPNKLKIKANIFLKSLVFLFFMAGPSVAALAEEVVRAVEDSSAAPEEPPRSDVTEDQLRRLRLQAKSEDVHIWDRYVRKFRRDHHLTFLSGWDSGLWRIGSFGRLQDEEFKSSGVDSTLQYTFHLQIISKLGYYLGSSAGYYAELRERGDDDFGPSSMWKLPGFAAGLVYNYDATGRVFVGAETYLSRIVRLETRTSTGDSDTIAVTGETVDLMLGWDKFVSLSWGLRVQMVDRRMWVPRPYEAETESVNASISRRSRGYSLGTVFHFL